jgi:hypothetical protein
MDAYRNALLQRLIAVGLSAPAVDWLLILWDMIQTLDDLTDGDPVTVNAIHQLTHNSLLGYATHPFFTSNINALTPVVANALAKWGAANFLEGNGMVTEVSFVWRASYYDVVLQALICDVGYTLATQRAAQVLEMYGESYSDYQQEF